MIVKIMTIYMMTMTMSMMEVNDDDNSDDNLNNDTPEARLSLLSQGGSLGASGPSDSRLSCS